MATNNVKKATVFQSLFNFQLHMKKGEKLGAGGKAALDVLLTLHLFLACVNLITVSAVYTGFVHTWIAGISQL